MKLTVNGITVPLSGPNLSIQVAVDPSGEVLPFVTIDVTGGKLDVYRSRYSTSGDIHFHLFGDTDMKKSTDLMAWPTLEEAQAAANAVADERDNKPGCCDHDTCIRACWIVYGYALSQCVTPCPMTASNDSAGRAALDAFRAKGMKATAINWQALIQFIIQIITLLGPILTPPAPTP